MLLVVIPDKFSTIQVGGGEVKKQDKPQTPTSCCSPQRFSTHADVDKPSKPYLHHSPSLLRAGLGSVR